MLHRAALRRILTEPKNAIIRQYKKLFAIDGVELEVTEDALGLRSIVETVMIDAMYEVPGTGVKNFRMDGDYVREKLAKAHFERTKLAD